MHVIWKKKGCNSVKIKLICVFSIGGALAPIFPTASSLSRDKLIASNKELKNTKESE